jgi:uncharacterized protein (TIGR04255 family)
MSSYSVTSDARSVSKMAKKVPLPPYCNPPIAEAVFAFHFSKHLEAKTVKKFVRAQAKKFPAQQEMYDIAVDTANLRRPQRTEHKGYIITDADNALVLIVRPETISVAQKPPYTTWENLIERAKEVWGQFRSIAGNTELTRLSARYINRIDIQHPQFAAQQQEVRTGIDLSTYFRFGLMIPPGLVDYGLRGFQLSCDVQNPGDALTRIIQLAAVPSPRIDHVSFVLDIDVATTAPVPRREVEMWALANDLRVAKNAVFESCITDETRKLFA